MFLGREQLPRRMQNKMQATLLLPTGYSKIRFRSDCGWYPNVIKWGLWGGFLCIDILHTRVQCSKHRGFFIAAMCKVSKVLHHVVGQGNREKFDGEIKLSFFSKNESSLSFWGCLCSKFYVWKGNFDVRLACFTLTAGSHCFLHWSLPCMVTYRTVLKFFHHTSFVVVLVFSYAYTRRVGW